METARAKNTIATLPVREALSAILSKCDNCQQRRPVPGRKWCKPCALKWQRSPENGAEKFSGTLPDYALEDVIPARFINAELSDLPDALVEKFLSLPEDTGLLLWGEPGRGKSHSLTAFAKHYYSEGWGIARTTYEMLCLQIRDTYKPGATQTELEVIRPLVEVDKLFLEDVGVTVSIGQQESDFSLRTFVVLLDQRLEYCRATFVTTNKSLEELARSFDERIASRLQQACEVVQLTGRDRRRQGTQVDTLEDKPT